MRVQIPTYIPDILVDRIDQPHISAVPNSQTAELEIRRSEGERRIVGHGGCGAALVAQGKASDTDLLCESGASRYSRRKFSTGGA